VKSEFFRSLEAHYTIRRIGKPSEAHYTIRRMGKPVVDQPLV